MVAKVAGGIIGLGLISTGGIAMAKPHWLGMDYMPSYKPLSEVNNYTDTYKDKFGSKHGKYWVSNEKTNEGWWNWSFRRLQEGKVNAGAFALNTKVNTGFKAGDVVAGTNPKSLSQVCDAAYKANSTSVKTNGNETNEFNEEHVWKYCSPFGGKLKTVKDVDNKDATKKYVSGKIGNTKESELISATGPENDKFWEIRDKEFKKPGNNSLTNGDTESYFVKNKQGKTIKELCEYAYGQETKADANNGGKIEETTVVKYCALSSSTGAS